MCVFVCLCWVALDDLAATDFPAPWGAVSWALVVFTFEFGMGSGVVPPPWPPGRLSQAPSVWGVAGSGFMRVCYDERRCVAAVWMTAVRDGFGLEPFGRLGPVS